MTNIIRFDFSYLDYSGKRISGMIFRDESYTEENFCEEFLINSNDVLQFEAES